MTSLSQSAEPCDPLVLLPEPHSIFIAAPDQQPPSLIHPPTTQGEVNIIPKTLTIEGSSPATIGN